MASRLSLRTECAAIMHLITSLVNGVAGNVSKAVTHMILSVAAVAVRAGSGGVRAILW
jgi:hypothetical protein